MNTKLKTAVEGLTNMQATYRDDASIAAKIELLIEEIHDFLENTEALVKQNSSSGSSPPTLPPPYPATMMSHLTE